jgi:hypothetical protein
MNEYERRKALGDWGERKAIALLKNSPPMFANVRDINAEASNHPFGDTYADARLSVS